MNVKQIKVRALAVEKTRKIVKAMQIVALTRLRKVEAQALKGKPYYEACVDLVRDIAADYAGINKAFAQRERQEKVVAIVIGSDKGMCGAFNTNLYKEIVSIQNEGRFKELTLIAVGKRISKILQKTGLPIYKAYTGLDDHNKLGEFLDSIKAELVNGFIEGKNDGCIVVYNGFKGHVLGNVFKATLLPIEVKKDQARRPNFICEPDEETVVNAAIAEYLSASIRQFVVESRAAEELARMLAMKSATDSAEKMLEKMMLMYHKARQASITKEIIEIINAQGV